VKLGNGGPDLQCEGLGNWSPRGVRIRSARNERNGETLYELHDRKEERIETKKKEKGKNREKDY